ncbi:element excision factor XisH family protein [Tumidithrix elongata]
MAKDLFHDVVKEALRSEGWQITHDTLIIVTPYALKSLPKSYT